MPQAKYRPSLKYDSPKRLSAYCCIWEGLPETKLYILARTASQARSAVYWSAKAARHQPAYADCSAVRASYYDRLVSPFSKSGDIIGWEDEDLVTGCCSPDGTTRSREELPL